MNPVNPIQQRVLRFSGVKPDVLDQLERNRENFKKDSNDFFQETLDVFVKRDDHSVELTSNEHNSKSLPYVSGIIRSLNRMLTGGDIHPTEVHPKKETSVDMFEKTVDSNN